MQPNEKHAIDVALKYFQILNSQIYELTHRVKILEQAMLNTPELLAHYQQAAKETKNLASPGLSVQLQALEQELQKILR